MKQNQKYLSADRQDNFEDFFHEKLKDYELPYNHEDWVKLEKNLPKPHISANIAKYLLISGCIAVVITPIILTCFYIINNNKTQPLPLKKETHSQLTEIQKTIIDSLPVVSRQSSVARSQKPVANKNNEQDINENQSSSIQYPISNIQHPTSNIQPPDLLDASFNLSISEGCAPLKVNFIPQSQHKEIEYLWSFGDGKTSEVLSPSHIYETTGTYEVKLIVKYKEEINIHTRIVTVKPSPVAKFSYEREEDEEITFTNLSTDYTNWKWDFGDISVSYELSPKHTYSKEGDYTVCLIVYNAAGCVDTAKQRIKVEISHNYYVPNAFTPNGDGKNDLFGPVGENLQEYEYKMVIYNQSNKIIFETSDINVHWDGKINGTGQIAEQGVYIWEITTKDKQGNIKKKRGVVNLM